MKKPILVIVGIVLFISTLIAGILLVRKWNQPLGSSLGLPTRTPSVEEAAIIPQISITDTAVSNQAAYETVFPTMTQSPTPPQPVCGGPPLMYILGVGADSKYPGEAGYAYGLADVIRIVRVDFVTPKVTVLTIPRDLWVEFPEFIEKRAYITHGKLNQAYLYGGPGMGYYEGPDGGPGLLARTIAQNYDIYVDHYGAVNMYAFERIIDALGGIDLYLDQDWDGRPIDENTIDLGYFTAGQKHMTGAEALRFSRIRKKYSEVARTDNQSLVICAIKDKVLSPDVVGSIPKLINSLIDSVQTDLTPAQISQLACVLPKLGEDGLQFVRFPDEMMVQGRVFDPELNNTTFVWDIPPEDIQQFIKDFENDAIPVNTEGEGMSCP